MEQLFAFNMSGEVDKPKKCSLEMGSKEMKGRRLVCRGRSKVWKTLLLCGVQIKFYRLFKSEESAEKSSLGCLGFLF